MSKVRIRVGSELVQLNAPRDEPFPVDLVEREIAQSRQRQNVSVRSTVIELRQRSPENRRQYVEEKVAEGGLDREFAEACLRQFETEDARAGTVVDQPPPTPRPDLIPVWEHVISDFKLRFEWHETMDGGGPLYAVEHALNDMRERDQVGRERYGTPLTTNNGRDHLVDAYQELLDGAVYLKAEWLEGNHQVRRAYHRTLDAILELRVMLDERAKKKNLEDEVGP